MRQRADLTRPVAAFLFLAANLTGILTAQDANHGQAKISESHGYKAAVLLTRGSAKAVLCPIAGGRVLEYSVQGKQALWLEANEREPEPSKPRPMSAGRFDIGPELTIPAHPLLWSGE